MNELWCKDKTIVITGSSGFIGSSLVKRLKDGACKIIALERTNNLQDKKTWKRALKNADVLIHLAAQTSAQFANEHPRKDVEINLIPVASLIETCRDTALKPDIIFAGTVTQVGITDTSPVNETYRDLPITVYDINKLAAEKYLQYYTSQMGGKAVTLRLSNVYGPGPPTRADRGVLNQMITKALKGKSLTIYGDGKMIRDYIYIDDVVNAFLTAGAHMSKLRGNYFVIGSGKGHSIKQMMHMVRNQVQAQTGKKARITHVPPPEDLSGIERRNFIADSTAFTTATGWKADVALQDGIDRTIDYFLKEQTP